MPHLLIALQTQRDQTILSKDLSQIHSDELLLTLRCCQQANDTESVLYAID
jgi:hypothetical protein